MNGRSTTKHLTLHRFLFATLAGVLLLAASGFAPQPQSSNDGAATAICYVVAIPLWILSIWYWHRHYKIRGQNATLALLVAIFFSGLAIMAMIVHAPLQKLFSKQEFGPCPQCGKTKLIRENPAQEAHVAQPRCPHCKAMVGPGAAEAAATGSIASKIAELQELLTKNIISQEEYDRKRIELVNRM